MNRSKIYFFISFLLLYSLSCSSPEKREQEGDATGGKVAEEKELIVYGSRTCPHCMVFIKNLDEKGIKYIFREVDNNDENFKEMYDKIKSINYKGYVNYPVIDVEGEIMVAPEFDSFLELYREPQPGG